MRIKEDPPSTPPAKPAKNADGFDVEDDGNPIVGYYIMPKKTDADGLPKRCGLYKGKKGGFYYKPSPQSEKCYHTPTKETRNPNVVWYSEEPPQVE
jgi:hypothetical protein